MKGSGFGWSLFLYTRFTMSQVTMVREWNADDFHAKVIELEGKGWHVRQESYRITPEMNPETGIVSHVHSIELTKES